jgi:hypothetical protein
MSARQFIPPVFVAGLVLGLLSTPWLAGRIFLGLYVTAYLLANLAASAASANRVASLNGLARLPVAFAILHLSYGSGFLVGLLKFWNRWRAGASPAADPQKRPELGRQESA